MSRLFKVDSLVSVLGELAYALLFAQAADEQHVIILGHKIAVQTLHHDLLLMEGMDDTIASLERADIIPYYDI